MSANKTPIRSRKLSSSPRVRSAFKSPVLKTSGEEKNDGDGKQNVDEIQKQIDRLLEEEKALDEEISNLEEEGCREEDLQEHIERLHKYNEMKDAAQTVMGRIANVDGVTAKEVHEKFGLGEED